MTDETRDRFANWATYPNGDFTLLPFANHFAEALAGGGCILRIEHWQTSDAIGRETPQGLQFGMTPSQARELGAALLRIAALAERDAETSDAMR